MSNQDYTNVVQTWHKLEDGMVYRKWVYLNGWVEITPTQHKDIPFVEFKPEKGGRKRGRLA